MKRKLAFRRGLMAWPKHQEFLFHAVLLFSLIVSLSSHSCHLCNIYNIYIGLLLPTSKDEVDKFNIAFPNVLVREGIQYTVRGGVHVSQQQDEQMKFMGLLICKINDYQKGKWYPAEDKDKKDQEQGLGQFQRISLALRSFLVLL